MQTTSQRVDASPRLGMLLTVLAGAPFLASLDLFVVNVAFQDIGRAFPGHSIGNLSWILNAYAIVYAALLIPLGRWADRVGRKRGFLLGLVLFTVASIGAAASTGLWMLVGFRLVQAVGAAALTPTSLGLLISAVPAAKRTASVRIWAALGAAAAALGPVVGGLLVELSWRWVFIINIPIGIALIVLALRFVPDSLDAKAPGELDLVGAVVLTVGIGALALALVEGPDWGWSSDGVIASFVVAAVALAGFWLNIAQHASPLIDPALLRVRTFAWANASGLLFSAAFAAGLLCNILWLQEVWGYSASKAGLAIAPGPTLVPVFSYVAQRLSAKVGAGLIAAAGCVFTALGTVLVASTVAAEPAYATAYLPGWLVAGVGVGLALPTILSTATAELPVDRGATGSAIVNMSRQIGTVLGISVLVAILGSASSSADYAGVHDHFVLAWWVIAAVGLAAAVTALGLTAGQDKAAVNDGVPSAMTARSSSA
ncbi:MFS transporter [Antrihabitans cavernicola]|uniref:MFS transporter n=1 Tax=Antrihabitans cavernicola TaxID=2495913 RepID=A0A5A7SGR9_9NOCA|nr:MFS transporter [Spelaeibacter cavernicola]KAA0024579.1 MFS transporter [Spelaeibacter cavernicola]